MVSYIKQIHQTRILSHAHVKFVCFKFHLYFRVFVQILGFQTNQHDLHQRAFPCTCSVHKAGILVRRDETYGYQRIRTWQFRVSSTWRWENFKRYFKYSCFVFNLCPSLLVMPGTQSSRYMDIAVSPAQTIPYGKQNAHDACGNVQVWKRVNISITTMALVSVIWVWASVNHWSQRLAAQSMYLGPLKTIVCAGVPNKVLGVCQFRCRLIGLTYIWHE